MWMSRRSRFEQIDSGFRANSAAVSSAAACPAFTLIELLVVVAIIALLLSILLPSLSGARDQAKAAVCGTHLRQFGNGLGLYTSENADWIPGMNTSGVQLRRQQLKLFGNIGLTYRSKMPVQDVDWMTPILSMSQELPAERARRWYFLWDEYRCPSQRYTSTAYENSTAPDRDLFNELGAFPAASYKMPAHFQYFGRKYFRKGLSTIDQPPVYPPLYYEVAPDGWEVVSNDYRAQLQMVGPAARKVFASDGTRYLPDADALIDHDITPVLPEGSKRFGAFTAAGAWWCGSTAFGIRAGTKNWDDKSMPRGSPSDGENLPLSYRHGRSGLVGGDAHSNKGTINAVFFDGHVERLTDRESREVHLWYPTGSVVTPSGAAEGMTNLPQGFVIP